MEACCQLGLGSMSIGDPISTTRMGVGSNYPLYEFAPRSENFCVESSFYDMKSPYKNINLKRKFGYVMFCSRRFIADLFNLHITAT